MNLNEHFPIECLVIATKLARQKKQDFPQASGSTVDWRPVGWGPEDAMPGAKEIQGWPTGPSGDGGMGVCEKIREDNDLNVSESSSDLNLQNPQIVWFISEVWDTEVRTSPPTAACAAWLGLSTE